MNRTMKPFDQFWGALAGGFVWYCLGVYHKSVVSIVGLSGEDCIFEDPGHEITPTGWDSTLDCIFSNSSWIIAVTGFQRILNTILSSALPTLKITDTNWTTSSYIQLVEGSLNSKLPTIWRVEKQMKSRWDEVKSEESKVRRWSRARRKKMQ